MKKMFFVLCILSILLLLAACDGGDKADLCAELGGHELQYVTNDLVHWQKCTREGCDYKTNPSGHTGGVATCQEKAKCSTCGASYGAMSVHRLEYEAGTSTHTGKCLNAGCTYTEEMQEHYGGKATCVEVAICEVCGTAYGDLGDHKMGYSVCEETHTLQCITKGCSHSEEAEKHSGGVATCTASASCEVCGYAYLGATGHSYVLLENGCEIYDECSTCFHQISKGRNHTLDVDGITCSKCKKNYFVETLNFKLCKDGQSYAVVGAEECKANTVIIPAEYMGLPVTTIGEFAFSCHPTMTEIVLPESLIVIESMAFEGTLIQSIVIPDRVERIEREAFVESLLENITLGAGVKVILEQAFSTIHHLRRMVIPGTVEVIEQHAFLGCEQLQEIVFEDGVKRIEMQVFRGCLQLSKVVLPQTLEYLHVSAFEKCPLLIWNQYENLQYLGTATNPYFALMGGEAVTRIEPHANTVLLADTAFYNREDIQSVKISSAVQFIGRDSLIGLDGLEEITADLSNAWYYSVNNLLVDKRTGVPCVGCKTSVVPDDGSITELNLYIFSLLDSIKTLRIPDGIKILHIKFDRISGLEQIVIGADVEQITVTGNYDSCGGDKSVCFSVYYCHTREEWKNVTLEYNLSAGALGLVSCYNNYATHYFYSETQPTTEGNYWHYVDGVPTPW